MSAIMPSSQILQRHESLFVNKRVVIAGDFHDDYPLSLATSETYIHCAQFHIYLNMLARNRHACIEFGLFPPDYFYEKSDTLIYYWPKNKSEAQFQLSYLLSSLAKDANVFIVGENRSGVKSAETLLTRFGSIQKIDSARRCSLYHFQVENSPTFKVDEWWHEYHLQMEHVNLSICGLPGIFSQKHLDAGSKLLLDALANNQGIIKGSVLDIGSGCGVLSAFIGKLNSEVTLTLTDVNAMALESSKMTLQKNQLKGEVLASNVFSHLQGRFDLIISNPPFHDGKETSYDAIELLINQAKTYLNSNGYLCIVANTFLPYQRLLSDKFNHVDVVAQTTKFKVYLAK